MRNTMSMVSSLPFMLVGIGIFLCPLNGYKIVPGLFWSDLFFFLGAIALVLQQSSRGAVWYTIPILPLVSISLLLLCSWVSFLHEDVPVMSVLNCLKIIAAMFFLPFLIAWLVRGESTLINLMLFLWLAGAAASAFTAIFGKFGLSFFGFTEMNPYGVGRSWGLANTSVSLGYFSSHTFVVALYFHAIQRHALLKALALVVAAGIFFAIILSGTRAALLNATLSILIFYGGLYRFRYPNAGRNLFLIVLSVLLTTIALSALTKEDLRNSESSAISRLMGNESAGESNVERLLFFEEAAENFQKSPLFGSGFLNALYGHSIFIQFLECGGIVGLTALMLWFAWIFQSWRDVRVRATLNHYGTHGAPLICLVTAEIVIWIVAQTLANLLYERNGYIGIGILLSMRMLRHRIQRVV